MEGNWDWCPAGAAGLGALWDTIALICNLLAIVN